MPKLRPIAPVAAQSPQYQPRNVNASAPAEAAAQLGDRTAAIGKDLSDKLDKLHQASVAIDATAKGSTAIDEFYQSQLEIPPHADLQPGQFGPPVPTLTAGLKAGFDTIIGDTLKGINDPEVKLHVQQQLLSNADSRMVQGRGIENKRRIDLAIANADEATKLQVNLAANTTDNSWATHAAAAHAGVQALLQAGALTAEQATTRHEKIDYDIQYARAKAYGVKNPTQTANDLEHVEGLYPAIPPVVREDLIKSLRTQADTNAKKAEEATIKADALKNKQIVSSLASQLDPTTPPEKRLTHQQVQEAVAQLAGTTAPMSREDQAYLHDGIDKPKERSSNPSIEYAVEQAVNTVKPTITRGQISRLYEKGELSHDDAMKWDAKLQENIAKANDPLQAKMGVQHTTGQSMIDKALGSSPDIAYEATKQYVAGSSYFGGTKEPIALANELIAKYQPAVQELGGQSKAAVMGRFDTAFKSYHAAQTSNGNLHFYQDIFTADPFGMEAKTQDLLDWAKKAGKDLGESAKNEPNGKVIPNLGPAGAEVVGAKQKPDGTWYGGHYIQK